MQLLGLSVMDISHIQHYLQQHVLFKLNASIIEVHKMSICSHSSVDTHTGSVENIMYNSFIPAR